MKLKGALFLAFLVFGFLPVSAGPQIEYQHKSLVKALKKEGITNLRLLEEMPVPASFNGGRPLNGKFFRVATAHAGSISIIYVGRVNSCRTGGCSVSAEVADEGSAEYFDYFILYDNSNTIRQVSVFNYQATHGQEVTSRGWLKQFKGHDGSRSLEVDKNIDSISGATISVHALTADVEMKTLLLGRLRPDSP